MTPMRTCGPSISSCSHATGARPRRHQPVVQHLARRAKGGTAACCAALEDLKAIKGNDWRSNRKRNNQDGTEHGRSCNEPGK